MGPTLIFPSKIKFLSKPWGGDLTIKIDDNTDDGSGIYSEEVEHKDQTLDDAEIFFCTLGHIILLKMKPFRGKRFSPYHL